MHHVRRPLEIACVRTSVLPSSYALFGISPGRITMIVQLRCQRSNSPHPWPIPIPTGGTPQPPRGQIPPCPFQGRPQTRPRPRRASRQRPQSSSSLSSPSSSSSAVSNPIAFVAFVVEVVPPPLRGKGRRAARAQMHRAWIQACGMVADVWWPFRSGGQVEGGGGAATLPYCWSVRTEKMRL